MRPIESLGENTILILFIHGADDYAIPPEHSERMKKATKGYAEIHVFARPLKADWLRCSSVGEDNFNVKPVSKNERRKRL